jgi:penicillin-binding protein 1B
MGRAVQTAAGGATLPAVPDRDPPRAVPAAKSEPADRRRRPWLGLLLRLALLGLGIVVGFSALHLAVLDRRVAAEFARLAWQEPTRVFGRPLHLAPGEPLSAETLRIELAAARYREAAGAPQPGSYAEEGGRFLIHTRSWHDLDGERPARRVTVTLGGGTVQGLADAAGAELRGHWLDPARIATLHGKEQTERRLVKVEEVPGTLLLLLQSTEDRSFKHHRGVDLWGILRAAWINLREGEIRQGGSTLTQQLVRSLFLTRAQKFERKLNEAFYALIIEARFDKGRILETYLNEVYLGQEGAQAVHGVGAGAEFWFGAPLEQLDTAQLALLVGLIQGPSLHDPRRHPERARQRRAVVLEMAVETGVLSREEATRAKAAPLGVSRAGSLPRNRYPAFMDLVRAQLERDYREADLQGAGLSIHTTLSPSAQQAAERAVGETLASLQQGRQTALESALVVTDTVQGTVEAVVGGRQVRTHGFNRALEARRPIGSLAKPFVYVLALAQPTRWSLASMLDDAPIQVRLPGGRSWSPENADGRSHGRTSLLDALSLSYNQATVRLGMELGPERVARLMEALAQVRVEPHPSLLLGSVDLSPMAVTQLYQFFAAQGQLQPLRAVRGVLDAGQRPLKRYDLPPPPAQPGDALAARLVGLALQEAGRSGTARRLASGPLARLQAAGKTGTSNDGRDSWFAGYSGRHLAVAWVGNDANQPTGLMGASGALRVWEALFGALPSLPLRIGQDDLEFEWIEPRYGLRTDTDCPGARRYAFVAGTAPIDYLDCR